MGRVPALIPEGGGFAFSRTSDPTTDDTVNVDEGDTWYVTGTDASHSFDQGDVAVYDGTAWREYTIASASELSDYPFGTGDLSFTPATQSDIDNHAADSGVHHAKPTEATISRIGGSNESASAQLSTNNQTSTASVSFSAPQGAYIDGIEIYNYRGLKYVNVDNTRVKIDGSTLYYGSTSQPSEFLTNDLGTSATATVYYTNTSDGSYYSEGYFDARAYYAAIPDLSLNVS